MRNLLVGSILCLLAACGSSGSETATASRLADLEARANAADALTQELQSLALTTDANLPETGSVTFGGFSALIIDPVPSTDADDVVMLGEVRLVATFQGAGTVTGTADNFDAVIGSGPTQEIVPVAGSLEIGEQGSAIGARRPNDWIAGYEGTLSTPDESYDITGELDGIFLGNRTTADDPDAIVEGIFGVDQTGVSVDSDGSQAQVTLEVLGTNPI